MNHINARFLILLLVISISACGHAVSGHHGFMMFDSGVVTLKSGNVVIKVKGHDRAQVSGEGKLNIGGADVPVTPQAQAALAQYNAEGVAFTDQAKDLGLESADFALHTIGQMFKGLLHGTADEAGQQADQGAQVIEAKARQLCQRMEDWRRVQDAAAAAAPEFKPYAVIDADAARDCYVESNKPAAKALDRDSRVSS